MKPETHTELNYQFLNTVSIREEEFRPRDLPDGWDHSPEEDTRNWLTKQTEVAYYNFRANKKFQQEYFLKRMNRWGILPFQKPGASVGRDSAQESTDDRRTYLSE